MVKGRFAAVGLIAAFILTVAAAASADPLAALAPVAVTGSSEAVDHPASNVLDGVSTTTWLTTGDVLPGTSSLTMELAADSTVTAIQLFPAKAKLLFPTNIKVSTSLDGLTFTDVVTAREVKLLPKSPALFFQIAGVDARFVQIVMNTSRDPVDRHFHTQVADVSIYTGDGPIVDIQPDDAAAAQIGAALPFYATANEAVRAVNLNFSSSPRIIDRQLLDQPLVTIFPKTDPFTPVAFQWKRIEKAADAGGEVFWNVQAVSAERGQIYGPVRSIQFATGELAATDVTPSTVVDNVTIVAPDPLTPPTFEWSYNDSAMKFFYVVISPNALAPVDAHKSLIVPLAGVQNAQSYTLAPPAWKAVRLMAKLSGGTLYWRVVAKDATRSVGTTSDVLSFKISGATAGGELALDPFTLPTPFTTIAVTFSGAGPSLVKFHLAFSAGDLTAAGKALVVPLVPATSSPITLTVADEKAIKAFAARNNVSTLKVRVVGSDAQGTFVEQSAAIEVSIP